MENFEIKERTKMSVKVYGQAFELNKPDVSQVRKVLSAIGEIKDAVQTTDAWITWLDELGVPRSVTESMEPDHLIKLIDFITGAKKN